MADRRRAAGIKEAAASAGQLPSAVSEVAAMLATIEAATARVEQKLDQVLAELASRPRTAGHPAPRHPVARHAPRNRLPCRGHQPRPPGPPQCARYRRDQ
jgi:hypothetical protein